MARSVAPEMRRGALPLFALTCGVMVANIYLSQPLLADISQSLGIGIDKAALVSAAGQVGYALGILFIVPLADNANPAKLVRALMLLTLIGLLGVVFSSGLAALLVAISSIALTCVVAQILIPLSTTLVGIEQKGRVVSKLTGGLILGILLSRVVSGASAEYFETWRAPFLIEAGLVFILLLVVPGFLPTRTAKDRTAYLDLLKSMPTLFRHRELRLSMALSFCTFAGFSAVWASLAIHLASPAFGLGAAAAGLFGLWGAPGALLAPYAGRMVDRLGSDRVNQISILALILSSIIGWSLGSSSLMGLALAINLLDFGQQSGQVANQARIFGLDPAIRARLNTLYMTITFSGGAVGAVVSGKIWPVAAWEGVCSFVAAMTLLALAILTFAQRRGGLYHSNRTVEKRQGTKGSAPLQGDVTRQRD